MFMKLVEAVEKAKELDSIRDIISSGGFLCSAYFIAEKDKKPENWNLAFYSKEDEEITAVEVTESGPELGVTDAPLREDTGEVVIEEVEFGAEKALEKAKKLLDEEFSISYDKVLFTLRKRDGEQEWNAVFVGKSLSIVSIALNSASGEVTQKERKSMNAGKSFGG